MVCISFSVDFSFFMHCELFARELTDDTLMATLLNSSVLEVYGWQLNRAIELGSAGLWETKITVNEMRNSEVDGRVFLHFISWSRVSSQCYGTWAANSLLTVWSTRAQGVDKDRCKGEQACSSVIPLAKNMDFCYYIPRSFHST
jgi:hypothetical protein